MTSEGSVSVPSDKSLESFKASSSWSLGALRGLSITRDWWVRPYAIFRSKGEKNRDHIKEEKALPKELPS